MGQCNTVFHLIYFYQGKSKDCLKLFNQDGKQFHKQFNVFQIVIISFTDLKINYVLICDTERLAFIKGLRNLNCMNDDFKTSYFHVAMDVFAAFIYAQQKYIIFDFISFLKLIRVDVLMFYVAIFQRCRLLFGLVLFRPKRFSTAKGNIQLRIKV